MEILKVINSKLEIDTSWLFSRSSSSFFQPYFKASIFDSDVVACSMACSAFVSTAFSLPSTVLSLYDTHASFSSIDFVLVSTSSSYSEIRLILSLSTRMGRILLVLSWALLQVLLYLLFVLLSWAFLL